MSVPRARDEMRAAPAHRDDLAAHAPGPAVSMSASAAAAACCLVHLAKVRRDAPVRHSTEVGSVGMAGSLLTCAKLRV
mgnify:CR=1 FL=1